MDISNGVRTIILLVSFLIFLKLFSFWLWLWQLKEYHWGRFKAHFQEGQAFKKIISGFWRRRFPKFTKKIIVIFFSGILLAAWLFLKISFLPERKLYFSLFFLILFAPVIWSLFILIFRIPTALWRGWLVKKARRKREGFKNLLVIGITGSYGKTSTKEILYEILAEKFGKDKILKTKGHQNSEAGIAQCILNDLKPEHEIFVCEMAAYNTGGIKLNCEIAKPKIGVLTGISEQHMATYGLQENIIKTKFELIESLPRSQPQVALRGLPIDTMAFFNAKNKYCLELYNKTKIKKELYGQNAKSFGEENILGAMAVAKELGMSEEEINSACRKIEKDIKNDIRNKLPGIQQKRGVAGLTIFDATYSANPDGVIGHLEYLKTLPGNPEGEPLVPYGARKIIVMSCLIELGSSSKEVHGRIGKKIAEVCDLAIITTKDRFKEIKEGAAQGKTKIFHLENPKKIFQIINEFCRPGDIALLEGRLPKQLINFLLLSK